MGVKMIEDDKLDLLQRLRYYRDCYKTINDKNLINDTIKLLVELQDSDHSEVKMKASTLLRGWKNKRVKLQTIKKQNYVGKN